MGRKLDMLDALLGRRSFNSSKLRALLNLSLSRLTVLKNQRHVRSSQARSDVVQLLRLANHDRALLRVEQVVKEQNLVDVYVMIESYCNLLIERVDLLETQRECPDELKEAISGLLFASSRCGDFPELLQIRTVFAAHFGKEFVARAVELRNNCGVSLQMIRKLSTKQETLEIRMKILKEIASENSISLQLGDDSQGPPDAEKKQGTDQNVEVIKEEGFSGSMKGRKKYKDVADAAQAAFESAAYAAEAARAAVELSRSDSQDPGDTRKFDLKSEPKMKGVDDEVISQNSGKSKLITPSSSSDSEKNFDDSDDDFGNQQESIPTHKPVPTRVQSDMKQEAELGMPSVGRLNIGKTPTSVRTRGIRGY